MKDDFKFSPRNLTVLVVDDHDPIRKGIKRVLTGMGFVDVVECFDGQDAIKVIDKQPIDLMILDLYMRQASGFDVLEHIKNRTIACDIPIIVVTGEASKEEIVKVADMGAEEYLLKPFQTQDLEKKIIKTLEKFHAPTPLLAALRRAERHVLANELPRALAAFEEALAIDPASARGAYGKAMTMARMNRTNESLDLLRETIRHNPSYHKIYGALADLHLAAKRNREALETMKQELEINPKQPARQVQLAKLLLREGDALGAVEHYRVALQDDPKRLNALMGMGHAYAMSENLEKALYYFKRVRRYHPKATKALEAAIHYAVAAKDPRRAELLLKDEKTAHPDRFDTYVLLALLLGTQNRDDEALVIVNDLLGHDAGNVHGLRLKASLLIKKNEMAEASAILKQLSQISPSADVLTSLGDTLINQGKIPEALGALHKSLAMNPEQPQAFFLLALAHQRTQQWLKASFLFRRAAQLGAPKERCMNEARDCAQHVLQRRNRPRIAS